MELRFTNSQSNQGDRVSGFTLIEVMIAMVVLAIGLLALAQLQVATINGLAYSRHFSVATQLAEGQLEKLMSYPFPFNEIGNPAFYPKDQNGVNIEAETASGTATSPFSDAVTVAGMETQGDGIATRVWSPTPVNEQGQPARLGEQAYVVCWTVERGGSAGTPKLAGKSYGLPGAYQVRFVVSAIWFDKGEKINAWTFTRPGDADPLPIKHATVEGMRQLQ